MQYEDQLYIHVEGQVKFLYIMEAYASCNTALRNLVFRYKPQEWTCV